MSATAAAPARRFAPIPTIDGLWALIAVVVPVAGAFASRIMAIDLAYQIRAGNVMLDTHRILDADTFTYTVHGRPWLNQQWGSEVLLALIHRAGGWTGIALARGLLLGLTVFLVYRSCRQYVAPRTAALLTLAGWLVGIEILPALRPQQFGFVLFAATLWAVTTRHHSPRRVWLVPLFMVAWANLHGSFPLGLVLLGLAWLEDRPSAPLAARRLLLVAGVAVVATFVDPWGPRVWSYVVQLSTDPVVADHIAEWGPPSVHSPTGLLFFLSMFAVALLLSRAPRPIGWLPLCTLGLFAGLGLLAIRGVVWWAMVAPVVVARLLPDPQEGRQEARQRPPLHALLAVGLVALLVVTLPFGRGTDPLTGGPAVLTYAPEHLVAAARAAAPAGAHTFVSQLYASWAELSTPGSLVAVDSRIEIFPETVWDDYYLVSAGGEGWAEVLDRWDVAVLILEPAQAEGLLQVIGRHPEWRLITDDAAGAVYARA